MSARPGQLQVNEFEFSLIDSISADIQWDGEVSLIPTLRVARPESATICLGSAPPTLPRKAWERVLKDQGPAAPQTLSALYF